MEIMQEVKEFKTHRPEIDEEKLMEKHEKAISTGQALLSLLCIRENSLPFVAFTERPNPQAGIVNNNGNTTSIMGNGAIVTNNNWIQNIVQNPKGQVCGLVRPF